MIIPILHKPVPAKDSHILLHPNQLPTDLGGGWVCIRVGPNIWLLIRALWKRFHSINCNNPGQKVNDDGKRQTYQQDGKSLSHRFRGEPPSKESCIKVYTLVSWETRTYYHETPCNYAMHLHILGRSGYSYPFWTSPLPSNLLEESIERLSFLWRPILQPLSRIIQIPTLRFTCSYAPFEIINVFTS